MLGDNLSSIGVDVLSKIPSRNKRCICRFMNVKIRSLEVNRFNDRMAKRKRLCIF